MRTLTPAHRQALAAMDRLQFAEAASMLEREPGWLAQNDLALCLSMTGRESEAMRILDRELEGDPRNGFLLLNRYYVEQARKLRLAPAPRPLDKVISTMGEGPPAPAFSVVMPTYNRPRMIAESVESVLAQEFSDLELIVVNDGGDRAVEDTLKRYLGDGRVRYALSEHGGLSSARNVGMALARGEYICQLDDDDVYYPGHLKTVMAAFRERPSIKVVYGDTNRAFQEKMDDKWVTVRQRVAYSVDFDRRAMRHQSYVPVVSFAHAQRCIERAGYYHEGILRAMDWEFLIRLASHYDFFHLKEVTTEQRERADRSQMTRTFTVPRNYYRNSINFLHGFFPLTGARFEDGSGRRLQKALSRLFAGDREHFFADRLELRKLLSEPCYSMFHTLGKRLGEEGHPARARDAFFSALWMRPWELRAWGRYLRPVR